MTKAERWVWAVAFVVGAIGESTPLTHCAVTAAHAVQRLRFLAGLSSLDIEIGVEAANMLREFIDDPKPGPAACPACGALARKDGKCMGCDRVLQDA